MKSYLIGTNVNLSLVEHDLEIARAMRRGVATGGFATATVVSLFLWPAHPAWSFLIGFCIGAPVGGVVSLVFDKSNGDNRTEFSNGSS